MNYIFAYGRHSTNKQGITEDVQRQQIDRYCEALLLPKGGLEIGQPFWFYDKATSGTKPLTEREQGLRLWVTAQPGDHIVIAKLDRAFRSVIDGVKTIQLFKAKGVHLHILDVHIDTSTPIGEFILTVMLAFAQLQQRYISDRTREVAAYKKANGEGHGLGAVTVPIGWKKCGGKQKFFMPCEREREILDAMQALHDGGASYRSIYQHACSNRWNRKGRVWEPTLVKAGLVARELGYPKIKTSDLRKLVAERSRSQRASATCVDHAAAGGLVP